MALAERSQCAHIGAAAFHRKQAFAQHHAAAALALLQAPLEVFEVVVGKALELGAAGPHAHQQGVVDAPVGQHQRVAISQQLQGGDVGLKAAGEQQHAAAPQPLG